MDYIQVIAPEPPRPEMGTWAAESIEKINENLYKFSGLSFTNMPGEPVIRLTGRHYLGAYNNFYWHFIHEDLSNYEAAKLEIENLKLTLIDIFDVMKDEKTLNDHTKDKFPYLEFFLKLYPQDVYVNRQRSNLYIEEAYYVLCTGDIFLDQDLFESHGLAPRCIYTNAGFDDWYKSVWTDRTPYGPVGLDILTEKVKSAVSVDSSLPKKLFITRRDVNKRLEELSSNPDYEHLISERYFEDSKLETYFTELGYTSLALEELSYEKQLQYFMSATHIAGVVGAGFSKLFVSNPGTKLIEIHAIPIYGFNYGYFKSLRGIDYIPLDLRVLAEKRPMSFDEMVTVLNGQIL